MSALSGCRNHPDLTNLSSPFLFTHFLLRDGSGFHGKLNHRCSRSSQMLVPSPISWNRRILAPNMQGGVRNRLYLRSDWSTDWRTGEMPEDWWKLPTSLQAQLGCGSRGRNKVLRGRLTPLAIRKHAGGGDGALPMMRNYSALDSDFLVAGAAPQV
jgi:hypothetical protein